MTRPAVTLATRLTLLRILLIPVFIVCVLSYAAGSRAGDPRTSLRLAAVSVFAVASLTDALDGYLARVRGERTTLGACLDPIADKALMISAIVLFSTDLGGAFARFPLWFPAIAIAREAVLVPGIVLLRILHRPVEIRPTVSGKLATIAQMAAVGWVLVGLTVPPVRFLAGVAACLTLVAGVQYVLQGIRLLVPAQRTAAP